MDMTNHSAPAVRLEHTYEEQIFEHREVPAGMKMHDIRTLATSELPQPAGVPDESANVCGVDLVYRTIVARPEVRVIRENLIRQIPVVQ